MQGLALLGLYLVVALVGQLLGYGICSVVEQFVPLAGLPVFLAIFLGMLVCAWPVAVALMDWLSPEPAKAPLRAPVAFSGCGGG
jgi:glucose uptake protein GlcU